MKIRRLHIGDFGIIRNQTLDDLGQGLVVIGGPNRAGKTSFMQVLRYLGYGFPRGANLPPATHEYHVEATIGLESDVWDLRLQGHGNPRVTGTGGGTIPAAELFGDLDMFTYHQLFTISLDELRLLPEGVSSGEQSKLQSVLLGAGLADVARIPAIIKELEAAAYKIGAKHGNPSVAMFKPYHAAIKEGIKERDEALGRIDEYRGKVEELEITKTALERVERELASSRQQLTRLEILLHNYGDYQRWLELDGLLSDPAAQALLHNYPEGLLDEAESLQQTYRIALDEYGDRLLDLEHEMASTDLVDATVQGWQESLLAKSSEIELTVRNLSGIGTRVEAFERKSLAQQIELRGIQVDMDAVDETWQGNLGVIDEIAKKVDKDQLARTVKDHELHSHALSICQQLQQLTSSDSAKQLRIYWMMATITMVFGVIIGLSQPIFGVGLVVVGAVGLGLYLVYRAADAESRVDARNLKNQLIDVGRQMGLAFDGEDIDRHIEILNRRLETVTAQLEDYRVILDLGEAAEIERYGVMLEAVQKLQERIRVLRREKDELHYDLDRLSPALARVYDLASDLGYLIPPPQPTTGYFNQLAMAVEQISASLQIAKTVELADRNLSNVEQQIRSLSKDWHGLEQVAVAGDDGVNLLTWLQQAMEAGEQHAVYRRAAAEWQALKQRMVHSLGRREMTALQAFADEVAVSEESYENGPTQVDDWVGLLGVLYGDYFTRSDLEEALTMAEQAIIDLGKQSEELALAKDELCREIESLDTDQTLAKAERKIDEARRSLEPLAFDYSVNRVAALLLDTLHKQFIEEVQDELLAGASRILRKMTDGDYQEIVPLEEITEAGFQVAGAGGDKLLPGALSRATTEQLFLAVRLGRIQEIQPPLPVILDDCLVNFDTRHSYQAIRGIRGLAERHQVFVLTCHPALVEMIHETGAEDTQYWQLDRGAFSLSSGLRLAEHLARGPRV